MFILYLALQKHFINIKSFNSLTVISMKNPIVQRRKLQMREHQKHSTLILSPKLYLFCYLCLKVSCQSTTLFYFVFKTSLNLFCALPYNVP